MADFLLIHGGSHGAWCWDGLVAALDALGHTAVAIDLPGHGNDATPRVSVTFQSYVARVDDFIKSSKMEHWTVVGHSLAGIILPEIAARHPPNIRELVFLAGLVLNQGEAAIDLIPEDRRIKYFEMAAHSPEHSILFNFETARNLFFSDLTETEARGYYARLTPQPLAVYLQAARFSPRPGSPPCRYMICKKDKVLPRELCLSMAQKLGVEVEEIDAGHDAMLSCPGTLAVALSKGP